MASRFRLSKSRFTAGLQCHKQLWWKVHEPDAPELVPSPAQRAIFDQGTRVGEVARTYVPGGVLVDAPHNAFAQRLAMTKRLLDQRVPAIYEASFNAGDVYAAVDILERDGDRLRLIEVKSSTRLKDEHIPDVAVQLHVLRASGLDVARAELMHLNRECAYPDLEDLFLREDVTDAAEALQPGLPELIAGQLRMLAGGLPDVPIGEHCTKPYECPFIGRCWADVPEHHVSTLYRAPHGAAALIAQGFETIAELPADGLNAIQARQRQAVLTGRLIVEPGLAEALRVFESPLAFLDFETVGLAIPVWDGCHPYDQVPVQFSCHRPAPDGTIAHHEWLADGPGDPRPELARALVAACRGARTVVAYNAHFEGGCIRMLAEAVAELADDLLAIAACLADPLPIVRAHVYHPDFHGSFSLKSVLPALVPSDPPDEGAGLAPTIAYPPLSDVDPMQALMARREGAAVGTLFQTKPERREAMPATAQGTGYRKGETLFVSMELSSRTWKVTSTSEVGGKVREKNVVAGDLAGVMEEFCKAKRKHGLSEDAEVVSCYEAGRDGFWIHRELVGLGVRNLVVDPSSIEVDRRARRRKTDRIDGRKLLAHLLRWYGGERCWSVVAVPSVEEEDARQLHRELEALKRERTRHRNRISSLLVVHGIRAEIRGDFRERLSELRLRDGRVLPEHLRERLVRESERLRVVSEQIAELEAERRTMIRTSSDPTIEMVRKLMGLSGIGENAAWLWVMEFFAWRHFRNRREVGSLAGLTPTPHASGESRRELGIDKAGNPRVRAMAIEIAWCWVRYQPDSDLTRWWVRFANNGRSRRVGIVALARKLLVAMWRYLEFDCVPQGARLKAA